MGAKLGMLGVFCREKTVSFVNTSFLILLADSRLYLETFIACSFGSSFGFTFCSSGLELVVDGTSGDGIDGSEPQNGEQALKFISFLH